MAAYILFYPCGGIQIRLACWDAYGTCLADCEFMVVRYAAGRRIAGYPVEIGSACRFRGNGCCPFQESIIMDVTFRRTGLIK